METYQLCIEVKVQIAAFDLSDAKEIAEELFGPGVYGDTEVKEFNIVQCS